MSLKWLPNTLTIMRCGLAFGVAALILQYPAASLLPLIAFGIVAATDFLDGWAARRFDAVSAFGAFIDPIADKLLVGLSLLALAKLQDWALVLLVPTLSILARDIIATGLRLVPSIKMPVSRLAKWKTAIEMIGIAALLIALAVPNGLIETGGLILVWLAAILSIYTLGLYVGAVLADRKQPHP